MHSTFKKNYNYTHIWVQIILRVIVTPFFFKVTNQFYSLSLSLSFIYFFGYTHESTLSSIFVVVVVVVFLMVYLY